MSPLGTGAGTAIAERPSPAAPPVAPPAPEGAPEQAPEERHLHLVPRPRRDWAGRRRLVVGAFIAATAALCLALVTLHVLMAENQFKLDGLQQEAAAQQARYEQLRLEVSQLEAPARIVALAEGRFGMVQPASVTYLSPIWASAKAAKDDTGSVGRPASQSVKLSKEPAGPSGSGPSAAGPAGRASTSPTTAPAGDADWPIIKPFLSGNP